MEKNALKPYIVTIVLMAFTALALAVTVDPNMTDAAGITVELPLTAGEWSGEQIRFCQQSGCIKSWMLSELEHPDICPSCDGEVLSGARAEVRLLPKDTKIHKKSYTNQEGLKATLAVVLSGNDRTSIHRPELCLSGQGSTITNSVPMEIKLEGREKPLPVRVLELERTVGGPDGKNMQISTFYVYWFVGQDRETNDHIKRMYYMAADRILRNVAHRWAYISVSGAHMNFPDNDYLPYVTELIQEAYPQISKIK